MLKQNNRFVNRIYKTSLHNRKVNVGKKRHLLSCRFLNENLMNALLDALLGNESVAVVIVIAREWIRQGRRESIHQESNLRKTVNVIEDVLNRILDALNGRIQALQLSLEESDDLYKEQNHNMQRTGRIVKLCSKKAKIGTKRDQTT